MLTSQVFSVQQDRRIYDRCHRYDTLGFCSPNIFINPDLAIVAGSAPTLYGEVESNTGIQDDAVLDKLNRAVARILCYTDRCFSVYAKSDELKILFYQRDENVGKVYVQTELYTHSKAILGSQPLLKSLTDAVYGQLILGVKVAQRQWGLEKILCDLVKIMMINEQNAPAVFQAAAQRDQYASQSADHNNHLLSKSNFPQGVGATTRSN